ncbi:hypothetical protein NMD10_27650 (plasmid) [Citrobacter portucalensis]|uniref:hypothetical protein n=1 Tax=Citrobacter portucalensis TaxID=1639133 RepID=UPI00351D1ADB
MTTIAVNQTLFALELDRSAGKPLNLFRVIGWSVSALGNIPLTSFLGHFFDQWHADANKVTINGTSYYFSPQPPAGSRVNSPSGELVLMPVEDDEISMTAILKNAASRVNRIYH